MGKNDTIKPLMKNSDQKNEISSNGISAHSLVAVVSGPMEGLFACVLSLLSSPPNSALLKLANDEEVIATLSDLMIVDKKSLSEDHPAQELLKSISSSSSSTSKNHTSSSQKHKRDQKSGKKSRSPKKQKTSHKSRSRSPSPVKDSWVRSNIVVKINSKVFANAKYYNKKVLVVDVIKRGECTVKLDNGKIVEGVKENMLETVIPNEGGKVITVRGKHKGKIGTMLQKDRSKEIVYVQFDDDDFENEMASQILSMDDVSQYVEEAD